MRRKRAQARAGGAPILLRWPLPRAARARPFHEVHVLPANSASDALLAPARSRAPDLLFEDVLTQRVADLGALVDEPERVGAEHPLHRVTVFLTYRCNLACPYCKTIARTPEELALKPAKAKSFAFEDF